MCAARSMPMRCLSPAQLATLSAADQQQILAARQAAALRQALAQEALANASSRFAAIQSLIAAIGCRGRSEGHSGSAGADQRGARHAAKRANEAAGPGSRRAERKNPSNRAARAGAGHRRSGPIRHPLSAGAVSAVSPGATRSWDSSPPSGAWLNGQLAHLHRQQHGAPGGGAGARRGDAGDAVCDGLGLSASDGPDRRAVRRRAEAHHHAGGGLRRRAASVALQRAHRGYLLQRARTVGGRRDRRRRSRRDHRCDLGERRNGRRTIFGSRAACSAAASASASRAQWCGA